MKRRGYRLIFQPDLRCALINNEDARALFRKVFMDGAGYIRERRGSLCFLLPAIGFLKFSRIAIRNLVWQRDILSIALFIPSICMSLVWVAGGLHETISTKNLQVI